MTSSFLVLDVQFLCGLTLIHNSELFVSVYESLFNRSQEYIRYREVRIVLQSLQRYCKVLDEQGNGLAPLLCFFEIGVRKSRLSMVELSRNSVLSLNDGEAGREEGHDHSV